MDGMLTDMPMHYAGGGFPWGLLILAGIAYFLWSKGAFARFGNGPRYGRDYGGWHGPPNAPGGPGYGPGAGAGQGSAPGFGGPRAMFEEWHRQAHEDTGKPHHGEAAATPPAASPSQAASGNSDSAQ